LDKAFGFVVLGTDINGALQVWANDVCGKAIFVSHISHAKDFFHQNLFIFTLQSNFFTGRNLGVSLLEF